METHRTREPFFLLNMRNNKRNTLFVPSFCHMCVRFSSLVDLVGSIFFTVLHCPEVTSKVAKYDEHVGLARMEGKVC